PPRSRRRNSGSRLSTTADAISRATSRSSCRPPSCSPTREASPHPLSSERVRTKRRSRVTVASVFITGSADGLGRLAAQRLVTLGHEVVLHGRDRHRAEDAMRAVPGARSALVGDLASIEETRALAEQANAAGPFQ